MITLEVRRHSIRKNTGGSQLSQAGVDLARRVGAAMGPFAVVACSVVPRARETAVAMGFAVDHELVTLCHEEDMYADAEQSRWWESDKPFVELAGVLALHSPYYRYANSISALWRDLLTPLSDGQSALFVGHSGELEAALVASLPDADHTSWGPQFNPCEGVRLSFGGSPARFTDVEFLRLTR